jgi:hypothetical protein
MTSAPSHLIALSGGRIRVLRLFAGRSTYALRYDVQPSEEMCFVCGCTSTFGCPGGCAWVDREHALCSACLEKKLLP